MSLKDFEIISKLGEGAYSTVYKVKRLEDQKLYALKRVKIMSLSAKQKQNALNQIRILASIRHSNVISYKEAFLDQNTKSLCIVMQFANNGDLSHRITFKQRKKQHFKEEEIWQIFIQIVKGLKQLHSRNIFHRDIKSANIFLHSQDNVVSGKLGDMNVSKISQQGLCMTQTGTPYYASPEVWKDKPYGQKSDIWSLGCVLYEIITLKPPFKAEDMEGLYKKVTRGIYQRIPSDFSQDLSTMIRVLLQVNPELRPSCQKILNMPIVIKRMKDFEQQKQYCKPQLLRTIRVGESFGELGDNLPKANYLPSSSKLKKQKGMKSLIDTIQQKTLCQVESLPALEKEKEKEKEKKIKNSENSDRVMLKEKHMLTRERKKSQMGVDRERSEKINKIGFEINGINNKNTSNQGELKQLKLPKVQNRCKQRLYKQKSLRIHKIYE